MLSTLEHVKPAAIADDRRVDGDARELLPMRSHDRGEADANLRNAGKRGRLKVAENLHEQFSGQLDEARRLRAVVVARIRLKLVAHL